MLSVSVAIGEVEHVPLACGRCLDDFEASCTEVLTPWVNDDNLTSITNWEALVERLTNAVLAAPKAVLVGALLSPGALRDLRWRRCQPPAVGRVRTPHRVGAGRRVLEKEYERSAIELILKIDAPDRDDHHRRSSPDRSGGSSKTSTNTTSCSIRCCRSGTSLRPRRNLISKDKQSTLIIVARRW